MAFDPWVIDDTVLDEDLYGDAPKPAKRDLADREYVRDEGGRFAETGGAGSQGGKSHLSKLVDTIKQPDGGFTVHVATGETPTTGFAISMFKGRETVVPVKDLTLKDLAAFALKNHDLLSQGDNYFGAWHNPKDGQVYMDVSKVVTDAAEAERLGQEHDQIAYFDLKRGTSVDVGKKAA